MLLFNKRAVASLLSATMCISFATFNMSIVANAEDSSSTVSNDNTISTSDIMYAKTNLFPALEADLIYTPEALGFTSDNVQSISLGDAFTINTYDGGNFNDINDIMYFPIISDNNILALLTLTKYNGELSASIGKDFADELSDYLDDNDDTVALFSYEQDIFGIDSSSNVEVVFDSPDNNESRQPSMDNILYADVVTSSNVLSVETLYESTTDIDISGIEPTRSYNYLIYYPIVYQGNYGICWAATVAAMVIYEVSYINNLTATQVCDAIGHGYNGGTKDDIIEALEYYLPSIYLPMYYPYVMSQYDIKTIINNDDPACMLCHDINNSNNRHAVSLCGYSEWDGGFQIRIMDSAYQCFKFSTYSSANGYLFPFGNTQYKWDYTVRLLYNL